MPFIGNGSRLRGAGGVLCLEIGLRQKLEGADMLSPEDQQLLGIASAHRRPRRSSAVSQTLRAIDDWMAESPEKWPAFEEKNGTGYNILVASGRDTRERAYALAHRVYRAAGYIAADAREL